MSLDKKKLYELLIKKGVSNLYHANSAQTTVTYFQSGGIASRGLIEHMGLLQTPQSSDSKDREVGVWESIFFDFQDLHRLHRRQNHYGPVLMKFDATLLLDDRVGAVHVTKSNPVHWSKASGYHERYFTSVEEFECYWVGDLKASTMLVVDGVDSPAFEEYLVEIVLDQPPINLGGIANLGDCLVKSIAAALFVNQLKVPIVRRTCTGCYCNVNYQTEVSESDLRKRFL